MSLYFDLYFVVIRIAETPINASSVSTKVILVLGIALEKISALAVSASSNTAQGCYEYSFVNDVSEPSTHEYEVLLKDLIFWQVC